MAETVWAVRGWRGYDHLKFDFFPETMTELALEHSALSLNAVEVAHSIELLLHEVELPGDLPRLVVQSLDQLLGSLRGRPLVQ